MDAMAETVRAAVFTQPGEAMELRELPLPGTVAPGALLCRVDLTTVCGSDVHTVAGRRTEPAPLVLGHEIVGTVMRLPDAGAWDATGAPLQEGDRVSWSIMAACGGCFYCTRGLPQKCSDLRKYGHRCIHDWPGLTGGYAEAVYLYPGTTVYKVPPHLPDAVVAPANCALATVINGLETIGVEAGDAVFIQGAGLLGLNLAALCREAGAGYIAVSETQPARRQCAQRFGADVVFDPADPAAALTCLHDATGGRGIDVAFEVCGVPSAVPFAIERLRTGGRYLVAGLVTPDSRFELDGNALTRKCLTLRGIHNYRPEHLGQALDFLAEHAANYPYTEIIGATFPLEKINEALHAAAQGHHIRVAVKP